MRDIYLSVLLVIGTLIYRTYSCEICPSRLGTPVSYEPVYCIGGDSISQSIYNEVLKIEKENAPIPIGDPGPVINAQYQSGGGQNTLGRRYSNHFQYLSFCRSASEIRNVGSTKYYFETFNGLINRCYHVHRIDVTVTGSCSIQLSSNIKSSSTNQPRTSTTTTPQITTTITTTTSAPTITSLDLKACRKMDTIAHLAHNDVIKIFGLKCMDGIHGLSENVLIQLCGAPLSINWKRGNKVVDDCSKIPKFTAVASFPGNSYMHDGLAGVLMECSSTELKIATEDCHGGFKIMHLTNNARDSYSHNAESFYTVWWN